MATDIFDLSGKVALITGASSGLGRHFSKTLSEAGATVILSARRMDNLVELQKELNGKSHIFSLDVTSTESVKKLFEEIKKEFGSADILVNNAGVNDTRKFKDLDEQSWNYVLETNLNGAYRVAKTFTDLLLEQKKPGSVINIASILGLRVGLNLTSYAAAKAGLVQLTKSMALELARSGIRVNAIAPGYILTEINDDFFKTEDGLSYIKSIPMNRLGLESELDGLLLLLASDASSFMTGSIIPVDGGHLVNPL
ncbi:MAG: SDR family oxidoreductase [SAR86 cluster bacterium]|nr:SDR family oxidoreductase [SAR86 cluster bacterium]